MQSVYEKENISTQVEHCSTSRSPPREVRESGVDECGVFYGNPGRFDQFWTQMVKKAEAIDVDWDLKDKTAYAIR